MINIKRSSRKIRIGSLVIGGDSPVAVQSMAATQTQNLEDTALQIEVLEQAGADVIRIAVDNEADVFALEILRKKFPNPIFSVDLQENYRLAPKVAPLVNKIRYNPGHLYHLDKDKSILQKVEFIVDAAKSYDCAIRIGVNCGSIDPEYKEKFKTLEMAKAEICSKVRPAVSILPLTTHKMTDLCKSGRALAYTQH